MKEFKSVAFHVRLTPSQAALVQQVANARHDGIINRAFATLISEAHRGAQELPPLASVFGKTKSAASSDQEVSSAFQGQ